MKSFIVTLVPIFMLLIFKVRKAFHMLQQNWYNEGNRYNLWIKRNIVKVFFNYDLVFIPLFIFSLFIDMGIMIYAYLIGYLVSLYLYQRELSKEQLKKPLVFTARIKRLSVTVLLIYVLIMYFIFREYDNYYANKYYLVIGISVYLSYYIVLLANYINQPVEHLVYLHFKRQALKKLDDMKSMEVIGITGSYGKTSSKNIVSEILNVKYNALPTPKNFNTAYGLINTINNYLDKFSDYFVCEMGASKVGQIKDCADIVKPKYGIITCIGEAHLESFGSKKNIENTKFELIESLPKDGLAILNGDDEIQMKHKIKNKVKVMTVGIDNEDVDVRAVNIKLTYKGTSFDCIFKGDKKKYHFESRLLGKNNVYNLLTGILLGKYLGISVDRLELGVRNVRPVEHRLELKKHGNLAIIDDAYNSNPAGSKMAVEVLGMMPGKTIIVTPGMIELGELQYKANFEFGTYIAENKIDEVILVGAKQTKPILDGLKKMKYNEENIHILNDVKDAFPLINKLQGKETYVLLENDLPDIFNE